MKKIRCLEPSKRASKQGSRARALSFAMTTACLCMIVRDEAHVLAETLTTVFRAMPCVTTFVIADTGSVDDTKAVIAATTAALGVTGHVVDQPWVDFGTNRTQMLAAARELTADTADYLFLWDADDTMRLPGDTTQGIVPLPTPLTSDVYRFMFESGTGTARPIQYVRPVLVTNRRPWRYVGVLHEYLEVADDGPEPSAVTVHVPGLVFVSRQLGARSRAEDKFRRDADTLRAALAKADPPPPPRLKYRYKFYLGYALKDAGDQAGAIAAFKDLVDDPEAHVHSWAQERYMACLFLGRMLWATGDPAGAVFYWLRACHLVPDRLETIQELVNLFAFHGENDVAYSLSKLAASAAGTAGTAHLFLDETTATFYLPYSMVYVCAHTGRFDEAVAHFRTLFAHRHVGPAWHLDNLFTHLKYVPEGALDAGPYWAAVRRQAPDYQPSPSARAGLARAGVTVEFAAAP